VKAAIYLTSEDKPKEFIMAIKLLLQNAKYLDHNFGLAPLKNLPGKKTKIIVVEDDAPSNFTHLGQYALTSGNQIFERRRNGRTRTSNPIKTKKQRNSRTLLYTSQSPLPLISNLAT
jgi:hypothetical protein